MVNAVPDPIILPTTFNDDKHVAALFNVVVPDTFNELLIVVILFNSVKPDRFNDDKYVESLETNKLVKLVLLNNDVVVDCKFEMIKLEFKQI